MQLFLQELLNQYWVFNFCSILAKYWKNNLWAIIFVCKRTVDKSNVGRQLIRRQKEPFLQVLFTCQVLFINNTVKYSNLALRRFFFIYPISQILLSKTPEDRKLDLSISDCVFKVSFVLSRSLSRSDLSRMFVLHRGGFDTVIC